MYTLINDLVDKINYWKKNELETINEDGDVEMVISESKCGDLNKNDPEDEVIDYQLIVCSTCKFKTICNTELKILKASKHTFFESLE